MALMEHQHESIIVFLIMSILLFPTSPNFSPFLTFARSQLLPIVDNDGGNASEPKIYVVHVLKPNRTGPIRLSDRRDWYMSFLPNATLDSGEPRMVYAYHRAASGFAAWLTNREVEAMEATEGFVVAYPEREYVALTTYTPKFLKLNDPYEGLWIPSFQGSGPVIGVVDTGIKPTHPSFRGDGMSPPPATWKGKCYWGRPICNNKLIGAASFKKGVPNSPQDSQGHGTHVAGIAAGNFVSHASVLGTANGTASGMAPRAHLSIYKVLQTQNNGRSSDVLGGLDQAIRDGVDILSMSLGVQKNPFNVDEIAIGSFAAMKEGIVPVAAAGNYGPTPSKLANDAPWILTVGASSVDRKIVATVTLGNGTVLEGESAYQPGTWNPTQQLPIAYPGASGLEADQACTSPLRKFNVSGKLVLCWPWGNDVKATGENIKNAGGLAMIMLNPWSRGNTTTAAPHVLPASDVTDEAAEQILSYLKQAKSPTAAIAFNGTKIGIRPAPTLASFSSRGPSLINGGILKPDVVAPGVNILSASTTEVGPNVTGTRKTFTYMSGTSMATPHVSGIVALLKVTHPDWSPAMIKSAIMTTADPLDFEGNNMRDDYRGAANAYGFGAGHINAQKANDPGLVYELHYYNYVHYLCGAGFTDREVSAIIQNKTSCSLVNPVSPEQLNYPSISVMLNTTGGSPAMVVKRTLTSVEDASSEYQVDVMMPARLLIDVSPKTLKFSGRGDKQSFNVTLTVQRNSGNRESFQEGSVKWVNGNHVVRTPVVATLLP